MVQAASTSAIETYPSAWYTRSRGNSCKKRAIGSLPGFIQCNAASENPSNIVGFHAGTRPYVCNASYSASRIFKYVFSRSDSPMKTAAPTSCCQKTTATPATSTARTMAREENSCSCTRFLIAAELDQGQRESILARPIRST